MPQKTADAKSESYELCSRSVYVRAKIKSLIAEAHQRAFLGLREQDRIERGNDALARVCMIAFGVAIAVIAPVDWSWKIALFLMVMFLVGIVMPAISRARRDPC
jgi:hypothetical protein